MNLKEVKEILTEAIQGHLYGGHGGMDVFKNDIKAKNR